MNKKQSLVEETRDALEKLRNNQDVSLEYTSEDSKILTEFLNVSEDEIVESPQEDFNPSFVEMVELFWDSAIFEDIVEETLLEVEKGQMSKRGIWTSAAVGSLAGPLGTLAGAGLYVLYKKLKKNAEAARLKCKGTGAEKAICLSKIRTKEIKAKQAAVKKAFGKVKDPKKKDKAKKQAEKELKKLDKRLKDIKKREGSILS